VSEPSGFAERLRSVRENAGLSQYALAKQSGLSKQAVSQLELGEREPAWQTVQMLAKALGVDCRVFQDDTLELPDEVPPGKPGRPRKAAAADQVEQPEKPKPTKKDAKKRKGG
jgi:transcriptional regulator with XRE-family HTH domain